MGTLLVRDIDDDVELALQRRAARHGVPVESEVRAILRDAVRNVGGPTGRADESADEREARFRRVLSLGRPPLEPFDLKAFSDSVSDGAE